MPGDLKSVLYRGDRLDLAGGCRRRHSQESPAFGLSPQCRRFRKCAAFLQTLSGLGRYQMKIGVFTVLIADMPFEKMLDRVVESGWGAAEIGTRGSPGGCAL